MLQEGFKDKSSPSMEEEFAIVKHKRALTSKNSEGKADRCKQHKCKNIHATKNQFHWQRILRNDQLDKL